MAAASNVSPLPSNIVKLSKAITTHGGSTNELKFATLNAGILIRHKRLPFVVKTSKDGAQEVETDFALAAAYIADLTGVDELVLSQLSTTDFGRCLAKLGEMLNDAGN